MSLNTRLEDFSVEASCKWEFYMNIPVKRQEPDGHLEVGPFVWVRMMMECPGSLKNSSNVRGGILDLSSDMMAKSSQACAELSEMLRKMVEK